MNNFTFNTTSGIRFGSGMSKTCVEEISKKLGPNILFITDKGLMSLNLTEPMLNELNKYSSIVEVFQDVEADPSIKTLLNSIEVGKKINATGLTIRIRQGTIEAFGSKLAVCADGYFGWLFCHWVHLKASDWWP